MHGGGEVVHKIPVPFIQGQTNWGIMYDLEPLWLSPEITSLLGFFLILILLPRVSWGELP